MRRGRARWRPRIKARGAHKGYQPLQLVAWAVSQQQLDLCGLALGRLVAGDLAQVSCQDLFGLLADACTHRALSGTMLPGHGRRQLGRLSNLHQKMTGT